MLGLLVMAGIFFALPRWAVWFDLKEWSKDNSDKYGSVWHRQRWTVRCIIGIVAVFIGHFFWLKSDLAALLEGMLLSGLVGGSYFMYDFNPRMNLERAKKEPWITEWYVSRSVTTAEFDKLIVAVADKLDELTDVVLKRLVRRSLIFTSGLYVGFLVITLQRVFR